MSDDLAERVAKLREIGPEYAQWGEEYERHSNGDYTGRRKFTCICGFGTDWLPTDEHQAEAHTHLSTEHPEVPGYENLAGFWRFFTAPVVRDE